MTPEMGMQGHADALRLTRAVAPWSNGRTYLSLAENEVEPSTPYVGDTWRQLVGIRSAVDPDGTSWPTTRCRGSARTADPRPEPGSDRDRLPAGDRDDLAGDVARLR
jgi:hypothetical protein